MVTKKRYSQLFLNVKIKQKRHVKLIAILSLALLLSVLKGQIMWLVKIKETRWRNKIFMDKNMYIIDI